MILAGIHFPSDGIAIVNPAFQVRELLGELFKELVLFGNVVRCIQFSQRGKVPGISIIENLGHSNPPSHESLVAPQEDRCTGKLDFFQVINLMTRMGSHFYPTLPRIGAPG
jgi:hypothetical protein